MTNLKRIISAALSLVAVLGVAIAPAAMAEEEVKPAIWMQVSPVSNRVILNAGEELTYLFNVDNIGSDTFSFKVYASPYSIINESYDVDLSTESARTQISRWLSFRASGSESDFAEEAVFTLEPGGRQEVEYKVSVPENVPAGGQYASIVTEYVPSSTSSSTGVQTIPRVNLIVYGTTRGDTEDSVEFSDHDLTAFLTAGNIKADVLVKNTGNTDFTAHYEFKVKSLFGQDICEKTTNYDVLPDTTRRIESEWEETPAFGIFSVTSTVSALGESNTQSKIVVVIPIFVIIIMLLLLTGLIVWAIILIRKRQTRKSRILV